MRSMNDMRPKSKNRRKRIEQFTKSLWGRGILILLALTAGFAARRMLDQTYEGLQIRAGNGEVMVYEDGSRVGRELDYAENVEEDNKILLEFQRLYPEAKVLVACQEDLTDDGRDDLVVVFHHPVQDGYSAATELVDGGHIRLVVLTDSGDGEEVLMALCLARVFYGTAVAQV